LATIQKVPKLILIQFWLSHGHFHHISVLLILFYYNWSRAMSSLAGTVVNYAFVCFNAQVWRYRHLAKNSAQTCARGRLELAVRCECLHHVEGLTVTLRWRTAIKALFLCFEYVKCYWRFCVMNLYTMSLLFITLTEFVSRAVWRP
jgi:hypothetical protein